MSEEPSAAQLGQIIARALVPWFQEVHRDLSWRRTRDPYAIWVSEIMLQQTRVDTVERYFSGFMQRFPTVSALAAADEETVLQAWSGLGYYRRARLLHQGARVVAQHLSGCLPEDPGALRTIPGIGAYTAGAIASIAYDRPAALVDGNVARVFARLQGIEDPKQQGADAKGHWTLAQAVVEHGSPRILAQALMELGALVCTPKSPQCGACPIASVCVARAQEKVDAIPAPRRKVAQPIERWAALAVRHGESVLLRRRPATGLLAGLWCLPLVVLEDDRPQTSAVRSAFGRTSMRWTAQDLRVRHVFTHRIWDLDVFETRIRAPWPDTPEDCWLTPGQRPAGGLPSVTLKLLRPLGW